MGKPAFMADSEYFVDLQLEVTLDKLYYRTTELPNSAG
jgi:hypothetical protein